ncbi:hypothetical protein [Cupriavidus campinensis]
MTDLSSPPQSQAPVTPLGLLMKNSKLIVALGLVGALAGLGASQVVKPRWVAKLTVQIGQLASANQGSMTFRLLENQLTAADRYNLPASRLQVVQAMGLPSPSASPEARLVFDSLRASTGKSPDVISLQVSGYSRGQALSAMAASYKVLSTEHSKLFDPTYNQMKAELDDVNAKLDGAEKEYNQSLQSLKGSVAKGTGNAAQDVLVTNLATVINGRILDLKRLATQLRDALAPSRTYPTRMLGELFVPDEPNTPGPALLIASGTALGLALGALIAFLRRSKAL